ncbi:hypothetical protein BHM03_00041140 [Ensete ventricosum]|nr:hypothetical protein BHM03_00041140 [Ensete ventricosum]
MDGGLQLAQLVWMPRNLACFLLPSQRTEGGAMVGGIENGAVASAGEVIIPLEWAEAAEEISRASSPPPVVFICGPKNSGKSTFSRYLLNVLLPRSPSLSRFSILMHSFAKFCYLILKVITFDEDDLVAGTGKWDTWIRMWASRSSRLRDVSRSLLSTKLFQASFFYFALFCLFFCYFWLICKVDNVVFVSLFTDLMNPCIRPTERCAFSYVVVIGNFNVCLCR